MDLQVAEGECEEAGAEVKAVTEGEGALTVEEARSTLQRAQKKAERLRQEYEHLKPLLDKGFITRDELARTEDQLEEAEEELDRWRGGAPTSSCETVAPARAKARRAGAGAEVGAARSRADPRRRSAGAARDARSADRGLHDPRSRPRPGRLRREPQRPIRAASCAIGDRVFATQGIVTIPEVNRMLVEASVSESEVHRVQDRASPPTIRVEAFPELKLTGKVTRVGTLASSSVNRPFDDKRFDLVIDARSDCRRAAAGDDDSRRRDRRIAHQRADGAGHRRLQQPGHARRLRRRRDRHRRRGPSISASRTIAWSRSSPACAKASACRSPRRPPPAPATLPRGNALQPR